MLDLEPGQNRPASYAILKNRGLTPYRSKAQRNPRVKQRMRYDKASKRIKGAHAVYNPKHPGRGLYTGERSGINTNVVKSTLFK